MGAIRLAAETDAEALRAIYAPVVAKTAISFEVEPPDEAEMRRRIRETLRTHPWLVAQDEGAVVGYAYATSHRSRAAYQWSVDVSVYVHEAHRKKGHALTLYRALLAALRLQGFVNAYAGIALPNPPSVRLHDALGFESVGVYERVGFKAGAWRDVGWWQLRLQDCPTPPPPPRPLPDVLSDPAWQRALHGAGS